MAVHRHHNQPMVHILHGRQAMSCHFQPQLQFESTAKDDAIEPEVEPHLRNRLRNGARYPDSRSSLIEAIEWQQQYPDSSSSLLDAIAW